MTDGNLYQGLRDRQNSLTASVAEDHNSVRRPEVIRDITKLRSEYISGLDNLDYEDARRLSLGFDVLNGLLADQQQLINLLVGQDMDEETS